MLTLTYFVVTFCFYCWLFQSQDEIPTTRGDLKKATIDYEAENTAWHEANANPVEMINQQAWDINHPQGWGVVEARKDWDVCSTLEHMTIQQLGAVELSSLSIRDLKKLASVAKVKNYSTLTKSELVEVLAAC